MALVIPYGSSGNSGNFTETDVSQYFHFAGGEINAKIFVNGQLTFLAIITAQTTSTVEHISPNSGLGWAYTVNKSQIPQSIQAILLPKFIEYNDSYFTAFSEGNVDVYKNVISKIVFHNTSNGLYTIMMALENYSESTVELPAGIKASASAMYINQT